MLQQNIILIQSFFNHSNTAQKWISQQALVECTSMSWQLQNHWIIKSRERSRKGREGKEQCICLLLFHLLLFTPYKWSSAPCSFFFQPPKARSGFHPCGRRNNALTNWMQNATEGRRGNVWSSSLFLPRQKVSLEVTPILQYLHWELAPWWQCWCSYSAACNPVACKSRL